MFDTDKYQEFDNKIFDITRIMLDFSLTEGQKSELRAVMDEMEAAHREGLLTDAQHGRLLCTMADCGIELPPVAVDQVELEKRLAAYTQSVEFQQDIAGDLKYFLPVHKKLHTLHFQFQASTLDNIIQSAFHRKFHILLIIPQRHAHRKSIPKRITLHGIFRPE